MERSGARPRDETGGPSRGAPGAEVVRSLVGAAGLRADVPATVTLPAGEVFFRSLETDIVRPEHLRQVLAFELEDDLPVPAASLVMDICSIRELPDGNRGLLVGAVPRSLLRAVAGDLEEAGIQCRAVDADVCALLALARRSVPEVADGPFMLVYVDEGRAVLGVSDRGRLLTARCLPPVGAEEGAPGELAKEMELTWRDAFDGPAPPSLSVILGGDAGLVDRLAAAVPEETPCEVTTLDPFASVEPQDTQSIDPMLAVAIGAALRGAGGAPGGMDFLAAEAGTARSAAEVKKALVVFGLLLAAVALTWIVGLFLRLDRREREYQAVRAEMRRVFKEALPDEVNIVDELQQLDQRLQSLREEHDALSSVLGGGLPPLRVLQHVSTGIPARLQVEISELSIAGDSVRLTGKAESFAAVDEVTKQLQAVPGFRTVATRDAEVEPRTGAVRFTLTITTVGR